MVPLVKADAGSAAVTPGLAQAVAGLFSALLQATSIGVVVKSAGGASKPGDQLHPAKQKRDECEGEEAKVAVPDEANTAQSLVPMVLPVALTEMHPTPANPEVGDAVCVTPELPTSGKEDKAASRVGEEDPKKEDKNAGAKPVGESNAEQVQPVVGEAQVVAMNGAKRESLRSKGYSSPTVGPVTKNAQSDASANGRDSQPARDAAPAVNGAEQVRTAPAKAEVNKSSTPEAKRESNEKEAKLSPTIAVVTREAKPVANAAPMKDETILPGDATNRTSAANEMTRATIAVDAVTEHRVPPVALNTERLVEHLGGAAMNFTVRMNDSAQVQVTTNVHDRTIEVGMLADRPETVSALRSEVPYLENRLRGQSVELGEVRISMNQTGTMNSGYSGEHRARQEWRTPDSRLADADERPTVQPEEAMTDSQRKYIAVSGWLA